MFHVKQFEPVETASIELTEKRSRFIATAFYLADSTTVKKLIADQRQKRPAAAHVVHAFATGISGSSMQGASDDGEPHGTAGRPILEIINGRNLSNILVTVVRYFGGTKLGTGGLVRAYGGAAKLVLDSIAVQEISRSTLVTVQCSYEVYARLGSIIAALDCDIVSEQFGDQITIDLKVRFENWRLFDDQINQQLGQYKAVGCLSLRYVDK